MRRGFTFIELAIGIAIVGILAALALPRFTQMQLRAKRVEVNANTAGLFDALKLYSEVDWDAAKTLDTGLAPMPAPTGSTGKELRDFYQGVGTAKQEKWKQLGWEPDGQVRCSYLAHAAGGTSPRYYYAHGMCDIDGDGLPVFYYHYGPAFEGSVPASQYPISDQYPTRF